jgi:16S rRNA (guanine527-N7)-methyltransferase
VELGCAPEPDLHAVAQRLAELALLLAAWAQRMNLTAQRTPEAALHGLIFDALGLERVLPAAPTVADLGAGAGFPGLPLAVVRPRCRVTLVEARERRHHFQRAAVRQLDLRNVLPRLGRAESLPAEAHALVVAQAMARPERALAWMAPWVAAPGWLAIPGASVAPAPPPGLRLVRSELVTYRIPLTGRTRTVWLGERAAGPG